MLKSYTLLGKAVLIGGGLLFAFAIVMGVLTLTKKLAKQTGRDEVTIEARDQALANIKDAKNAKAETTNRDAASKHADCLRDARNPSNCGEQPK